MPWAAALAAVLVLSTQSTGAMTGASATRLGALSSAAPSKTNSEPPQSQLAVPVVMCDGSTANFTTGCPSTATCCHHKFSRTMWGCCPFPNAVCCASSYGLCCPEGTTCRSTGAYSGTCEKKLGERREHLAPPPPGLATNGAPQVCTPGAMLPPSTTLPNAIVIGDSVSIGYTPHVISMLHGKVQVQHSPAAGGGGADDTPYGEQCIITLESFLRTAKYEPVKWDVITYNFGLHDMEYNATGGGHSLDNYTAQLTAITDKLLASGAKLLYVATTPFMPYENRGDPIVQQLNERALLVTRAKGIPTVDLWSVVVQRCGPVPYQNCSICAVEPCSYHYNSDGYELIAKPLADAILKAVTI